jgi:signal transduction histidine kinase
MFPEAFREHIAGQRLTDDHAAFAELDEHGRVGRCGGRLALFGSSGLAVGERCADALPCLEGMVPATGAPALLPRVTVAPGVCVDVHVFPTAAGTGVLLEDVTEAVQRDRGLHQRANELALLRRDAVLAGPDLRDLFRALHTLCVELEDGDRLVPVVAPPAWVGPFVPLLDDPFRDWSADPALAFLGQFLEEARALWDRGAFGSLRSEAWSREEPDGTEFLYEATAVHTGRRALLLVQRVPGADADRRVLIQKGRELALSHHASERDRVALARARSGLEEQVLARSRELEQANARLTEALRYRYELEQERAEILERLQQAQRVEALGTLAAGVAHDFNNVLAAVMGFAELGLEQPQSGPSARDNFGNILQAGERARKLIGQLLAMSRDAGGERSLVVLRDLAAEVLEQVRASAPRNVHVVAELDDPVRVRGDPTQLHQVLMNLCANAVQAMEPGGGTLRVTVGHRYLGPDDVRADPRLEPGPFAVVDVRDTGEGIAREYLDRIFDPFFTTKGPGEGTGIGLAVVHRIVAHARGAVAVDTERGAGSRFRVYWPSADEELPAVRQEPVRPVEGRERVLFVDDEPMQGELARRALGALGYRVRSFPSGPEALAAFLEAPGTFDVLVTDLAMPGLPGQAFVERVRRERPELPVIVCSGHFPPDVEAALRARGVRCLRKPARWRTLAEALREVLGAPPPP